MSAVLVTGGTGQLASAIGRQAGGAVRVVGRPDFDFDRPETIDAVLTQFRPRLVINTAAWTAVDAAEAHEVEAFRANAEGPRRIAAYCLANAAGLIHISTDYVFDGSKGAPYVETDPTSPAGAYGRSKLAGEQAVQETCPDAVILRTAWVYAEQGRNFVLTMLNAARRTGTLRVVADQRGCPTHADDLAEAVLGVAEALLARGASGLGGIYHACGSGETTWFDFARTIFDEAARHGWPQPVVQPIATADWPTPAKRPADSRLDCGKLARAFGIQLPDWRPSLSRAVTAICTVPAQAAV